MVSIRCAPARGMRVSLFAYWLWSCVVTVLILLTKYWRPLVVTLLNYFLQTRSIPSACRTCLHGWSKHFTSSYDPSTPFHKTHTNPYPPPPNIATNPLISCMIWYSAMMLIQTHWCKDRVSREPVNITNNSLSCSERSLCSAHLIFLCWDMHPSFFNIQHQKR